MRYATVCSGIEAPTMAWHGLSGWEPQWFSEIEPFPSAVLAHHYPDVPNLGDMNHIQKTDIFNERPVDLICGGTPCQSFSVAGLRRGLDDERGQLSLQFIRLAAIKRPRWIVWENVPGVLSSSGGADFAQFLGGLTGRSVSPPRGGWKNSGVIEGIPDAYGIAWTTLDAQYFGVAQRRKRVFVVGHLGDWRCAAAVLFDSESLSGNTAPSRKTGQKVTRTAGFSAGNSSEARSIGYTEEGTPLLRAGMSGTNQVPTICMVASTGEISHCLNAGAMGRIDYESETFISVFDPNQITSKANRSQPTPELCHTLPATAQPPIAYGIDEECNVTTDGFGPLLRGGQGGTRQAVAYADVAPTMGASGPPYSRPGNERVETEALAVQNMAVRRLTPVECAKLQGFPSGYTDIKPNGRPTPDGVQYKAYGNSMAVPVVRWIGERIQAVDKIKTNQP